MKKTAILIILAFSFVPIVGCIGSGPFFPGHDEYFYCIYDGVSWNHQYYDVYIEENELVRAFIDADGMFIRSYSHSTNGFGPGHYDFQIVNKTTNLTETYREVSISVTDFETAPGGSGGSGENLFVTNLTISYFYMTQTDAEFTGSDNYQDTDRLSEDIYNNDIALNLYIVEILEELLFRILGNDPDYFNLERIYQVEVS